MIQAASKKISFGKYVSTIEYGSGIAMDSPNQFGFFPVSFPGLHYTLTIHKAEVINTW
jgi:hypothetical protein